MDVEKLFGVCGGVIHGHPPEISHGRPVACSLVPSAKVVAEAMFHAAQGVVSMDGMR